MSYRCLSLPYVLLALFGSLLVSEVGFSTEPEPGFDARASLAVAAGEADSTALRARARDAQRTFELLRIQHAPTSRRWFGTGCDEHVGRMCLRLGSTGADEWSPDPEDSRVTEARNALILELHGIGAAIPGDWWVLGLRVAYLGEAGDWEQALRLTEGCQLSREADWWCHALAGMALHHLTRFEESEAAFSAALDLMSPDRRREWSDVERLVDPPLQRHLRALDGDSLARMESRIWLLADPLFLVPGNDRWTEHLSRHTLARIRSEGANPYRMRWAGDLTELLVRYGPAVEFERQAPSFSDLSVAPVIGRFDPRSRGFLPLENHVLDPFRIPMGEWSAGDRTTRARHTPPYASRVFRMDTHQARFRRGDDLLLVVGWRAAEGEPSPDAELDSGLFLLSGSDLHPAVGLVSTVHARAENGLPRGSATARLDSGDHLVSLELLDSENRIAWRARHGVVQEPAPRDLVVLSDLLLLEAGEIDEAEVPEEDWGRDVLESHLTRVMPSTELTHRRVEVGWEVYGLIGNEGVLDFRISVVPEDRGLLRRAGEFFRLLGPASSVDVTWEEEVSPDHSGSPETPLFRRIGLDLSSLSAGPLRITLGVSLPGRTEATSELVVELLP